MSFNVPGLVLHADVHTQEDRRMKTQISKYLWSLAGFALITPSLSAGEIPVIEPQDRSLQADFIEAAARFYEAFTTISYSIRNKLSLIS